MLPDSFESMPPLPPSRFSAAVASSPQRGASGARASYTVSANVDRLLSHSSTSAKDRSAMAPISRASEIALRVCAAHTAWDPWPCADDCDAKNWPSRSASSFSAGARRSAASRRYFCAHPASPAASASSAIFSMTRQSAGVPDVSPSRSSRSGSHTTGVMPLSTMSWYRRPEGSKPHTLPLRDRTGSVRSIRSVLTEVAATGPGHWALLGAMTPRVLPAPVGPSTITGRPSPAAMLRRPCRPSSTPGEGAWCE